jgi:hypothetical protein
MPSPDDETPAASLRESGTSDLPAWQCPAPRLLPELRGDLASWLAARGAGFYLEMTLISSQLVRPVAPDLATSVAQLAHAERRRVTDGELYWISPEMTALARHAGEQLTTHELYLHEMPSRSGFMLFAEPIAVSTSETNIAEIVAVSWGILPPPVQLNIAGDDVDLHRDWPAGAVWFTFYSEPRSFLARNFPHDPELAAAYASAAGPFMPDNELLWPLDQPTEIPAGNGSLTSDWGRTIIAAWLLMQQPLAETSDIMAPRPARRRLAKAGLPSGDVRLVHIRRPAARHGGPATGRETGREYSYQWFVGSHWRRYHVGPGRSRVERRYIAPYLAGPEDKPVRGVERVNVWDR